MKLKKNYLAVLITCHNRRDKTLACLSSLYDADLPDDYLFEVFLVDDGSTDGTGYAVHENFPMVNVFNADGNLFWAGGMRLAWENALNKKKYDAFLLLNDDVLLKEDCIDRLIETHLNSLKEIGSGGIYIGSTSDHNSASTTYGGSVITHNGLIMKSKKITPTDKPQICHFANANIMWVCSDVVAKIGIFDEKFTHGIADYDYTLIAHEHNLPVWVSSGICGICNNDNGNNWKSSTNTTLKDRINYLRSPKGLAYNEYLYYIHKHFPLFYPYSFCMLWLKTLFPFFWDQLKK